MFEDDGELGCSEWRYDGPQATRLTEAIIVRLSHTLGVERCRDGRADEESNALSLCEYEREYSLQHQFPPKKR